MTIGLTVGVGSEKNSSNANMVIVSISGIGSITVSTSLARLYAKQLLLAADFLDGAIDSEVQRAEDKD